MIINTDKIFCAHVDINHNFAFDNHGSGVGHFANDSSRVSLRMADRGRRRVHRMAQCFVLADSNADFADAAIVATHLPFF